MVRRNFDSTGTLEIYNLDTGTRVNRCKVKLLRQPSAALRAQIRALTPSSKEVVEEDIILPVPRITQSSKRATSSSDAPLDPSSPSVVTDTEDSRGENDASDPVVEQSHRDEDTQSTDADPDIPDVRSTDDTGAPTEAIIETEQSSADPDIITDELEANNTTSDSDEQANELITGVSEDTPTTTGGSDTAAKHDYPRRKAWPTQTHASTASSSTCGSASSAESESTAPQLREAATALCPPGRADSGTRELVSRLCLHCSRQSHHCSSEAEASDRSHEVSAVRAEAIL